MAMMREPHNSFQYLYHKLIKRGVIYSRAGMFVIFLILAIVSPIIILLTSITDGLVLRGRNNLMLIIVLAIVPLIFYTSWLDKTITSKNQSVHSKLASEKKNISWIYYVAIFGVLISLLLIFKIYIHPVE